MKRRNKFIKNIYLCANGIIIYVENVKGSTKKSNRCKQLFNNVTRYDANIKFQEFPLCHSENKSD